MNEKNVILLSSDSIDQYRHLQLQQQHFQESKVQSLNLTIIMNVKHNTS